MLIPQEEFQEYFNIQETTVAPEDYERASAIAEQRLVRILQIRNPDYQLPETKEELTAVQHELLLHLILIELIKSFNYIYEENKGRASLKLITSQADRLAQMVQQE